MTVKELKDSLNKFDDDLEIVALGHFGEGIRLRNNLYIPGYKVPVMDTYWEKDAPDGETVVVFPQADIGEEPD